MKNILLIIVLSLLVIALVYTFNTKKNNDVTNTILSSRSSFTVPTPDEFQKNCPFYVGTSITRNANNVNNYYNLFVMCPKEPDYKMLRKSGPEIGLVFYKTTLQQSAKQFEKDIGYSLEELKNKNVTIEFYPENNQNLYINKDEDFILKLIEKYWK